MPQDTPQHTSESTPGTMSSARPERSWLRFRAQIRAVFSDSQAPLAYLMNLPMLIAIFAVSIAPIGYSLWISLHDWNLRRPPPRFRGPSTYLRVLTDPEFHRTMKTTLIFTFGSLFVQVIVVVLLALLLNESFKGRGILRSALLLPWAIPSVVGGVMWNWVFNPRFGALNGLLFTLGIIDQYRSFKLDPTLAMGVLIFVRVWSGLPFNTLIVLASLQSIPQELYEQARVDRAGAFQRFSNVTLPWITQPLMIILILGTMNGLRVFDLVYILTGGGPGDATQVVTFTAWKKAFDALDFGTANAYAYILAIITLLIGIIYIKLLYQRGEIER